MWEKESAENLYKFLSDNDGFNKLAEELEIKPVTLDEAKKLAEAMVNKSANPKTTISKIIHDGDCFEIIRAISGSEFDPSRLDIWKDYVKDKPLDDIALKDSFSETTKSVREIRKQILDLVDAEWYLLHITGDALCDEDNQIKQKLEQNEAYLNFTNLINDKNDLNFISLRAYLNNLNSKEINEDINKQFKEISSDESKIFKLIEEKTLGIRGNKSPTKDSNYSESNQTSIEVFIHNVINGVNGETGFPNRSISMFNVGVTPFTSSGFLIEISPKDTQIVAYRDYGSGYGLKHNKIVTTHPSIINKNQTDALNDLKEYLNSAKGRGTKDDLSNSSITHNEIGINININNILGIFFTEDYNYSNDNRNNTSTAALNAIYTQLTYEAQTAKKLPIYKISVYSKFPQKYTYDKEKLLELLLDCYKNFIYDFIDIHAIDSQIIEKGIETDNHIPFKKFVNFISKFQETFENINTQFDLLYQNSRDEIMTKYFVEKLKIGSINIILLFNNLASDNSFFNSYKDTLTLFIEKDLGKYPIDIISLFKKLSPNNFFFDTYRDTLKNFIEVKFIDKIQDYTAYSFVLENKNFINFLKEQNIYFKFISKIVEKLNTTLNQYDYIDLQKNNLLRIADKVNTTLKLLSQDYKNSELSYLLISVPNPLIPNNPATLGINTISLPNVSSEKPNKDLSQSGKIVDLKDPQLDM